MHELLGFAHLADYRHTRSVRSKQTIDCSQEDKRIGMHEFDNKRGKPIVIAKRQAFNFFIGHNIILVDDGYDTGTYEVIKRSAQIRQTPAIVKIGMRQKHLPDLYATCRKKLFVFRNETCLSYSRTHLDV